MITYTILAGTVDVSVVCRAIDSADGTPETAFDHATTGIDLKYRREGAANVDITEAALAALTTAHTDGGVEQIGNGYFRLDLPDAACAAGVSGVLVHGVATGMVIIGCYINLTPVPVDVRQWLGTAAATPTVAGVPEVDLTHVAGATTDVSAMATNTAAILVDTGTTLQAELDGIQADTEDIQARLPAALTAGGNIKADALAISGDTTVADNLEASAETIVTFAVVDDVANSTTTFLTDLTEATNDHYNGRVLIFRTGALAGQATDISDYDGTTKFVTVTALTEEPAAGDLAVIV